MKIGTNAGHAGESGAVANGYRESNLNVTMNNALIAAGKQRGHTMINATTGGGYPKDINDAVSICNSNKVDLAISNHFNAGRGTGVEVLYCTGSTAGANLAAKVSAAIAKAYGLTNRGAKPRSDLGFLNRTNATAILIEWGFVDAPNNADVPKIIANPQTGANAVFSAISGTSVPTPTPPTTQFKVRINTSVLNIRTGPGTNYGTNGSVKLNEVYTITQTSSGTGANSWGKLLSGAGWISLDFTVRV